MNQKARPSADVSFGSWSPSPIYSQINEPQAADGSLVASGVDPVGDTFEVRLSQLAWPKPGQQTLTVRLRKTDAGSIGATIKLVQGSVLIAFKNVQPGEVFGNHDLTLTGEQVQRITDYTDLRVKVTAGFPIQVNCCPNRLPDVLVGTVTNKTGVCACLPDTLDLVWRGGNWTFHEDGCGGDGYVECGGTSGNDFFFAMSAAFLIPPTPPTAWACNPLSLTFDVMTTSGGSGAARITVTE